MVVPQNTPLEIVSLTCAAAAGRPPPSQALLTDYFDQLHYIAEACSHIGRPSDLRRALQQICTALADAAARGFNAEPLWLARLQRCLDGSFLGFSLLLFDSFKDPSPHIHG